MTRKQAIARYATGALIIAAAACGGDRATAPAVSAPVVVSASKYSSALTHGDTIFASMVYRPSKGMKMKIGEQHMLYLHDHSVCALETSGYGPDMWETPCALEKRNVTITAKAWVDSAGHPFVQFSPDLRLSPDDNKASWLALTDKLAWGDSTARIVYCPTNGAACVDESLADLEVVTQSAKKGSYLYRRIKHLSGYNILSGYTSSSAAW